MKPYISAIFVCFFVFGVDAAEVVELDGNRRSLGDFRVESGWKILGSIDDDKVTIDPLDVLSISVSDRALPALPKGSMVVIGSGEVLACSIVSSDAELLTVQGPLFGTAELPMAAVRGAIFDPELGDGQASALVRQIRQAKEAGDVVRLKNNDVVKGTLFEIEPKQIAFERDGNPLQLQRDVVQAIVFDPTLIDYAVGDELYAEVRFSDGSVVNVADANSEGAALKMRTIAGATLVVPLAEIVDIAFRNGKVLYLSDVEPAETLVVPFLDDPMPPRMNLSVLGGPLQLGSRTFTKGIGVRSKTSLRFELTGRFERFQSTVGLDAQAGEQGSVRFQVLVDDQLRFDSGEMTASSEPKEIDIPLQENSRLELLVDFAARGDVQDYANWCDARLVR